jgi:regulator of replication initiation timing
LNASQARCSQLEQYNITLTDQVGHLNASVASLTAELNDCRQQMNALAVENNNLVARLQ